MLVWCVFWRWGANHAGGGCSAKPAKRRTSGSQIHRQALADQQLHPHHTSIHHELPPYRQGRRPREASRHRPPHPAQRLRRGRLRQDQAVPSSSSPGTHCPWLAHMTQPARPDGAQQNWADILLHSRSTSHRMCTSPGYPSDTVTWKRKC
jgi:hypothetical protein